MLVQTKVTQAQEYTRKDVGLRLINSDKISLGLRELKFERELALMNLPSDEKEILNMALRERERGLEYKYNLVFLWVNLQKRGKFWEKFGCTTIHELLAILDLPNGKTLGMWEVLVRLFSKETFILVGDDALSHMTLQVSEYQSDSDLRKHDYQAIFTTYCKGASTFDKGKFYEIVHWYVNKTYVKPTGRRIENMMARPPRQQAKGVAKFRTLRPVEVSSNQSSDSLTKDFVVETRACAGCSAWQAYAESLEQIIRSELGAKRLPVKPKGLS